MKDKYEAKRDGLYFRVRTDTKRKIKKAAIDDGKTLTDYILGLIREDLKKRKSD